jgi:hypothetical protein
MTVRLVLALAAATSFFSADAQGDLVTNLDSAVDALNKTEQIVANYSDTVAAEFAVALDWCSAIKANKSIWVKERIHEKDVVSTMMVQAKAAEGQLTAKVEYIAKEMAEKKQSQSETIGVMTDEAEKLEKLRTDTNASLTTLKEMIAMMEERVAQDVAEKAIDAASLLKVAGQPGSTVVKALSALDKSAGGSKSFGQVLGLLKGMQDGLTNDLKQAEEDGAKKSGEYQKLLQTLQSGIAQMERNNASLSEKLMEKQTFLADRDEIMSVYKAIDEADRKQVLALADLCNAVKLKNKTVVKAAAAAKMQAKKARIAMESMPEIPKPTPLNTSNGTNQTNASDSEALFLQIDDEHHHHHKHHKHGHHHGHHTHLRHGKRLLALNSQEVLRRLGLVRQPRFGEVSPHDAQLASAAARVLKMEASDVNSAGLRRIASRVKRGSPQQDVALLGTLANAMVQREQTLSQMTSLTDGEESDEAWCAENRVQILAMERDAQQKEDLLNIRHGELRGRNESVQCRLPLVTSSANEANNTIESKKESFEPLEEDLGKVDGKMKAAEHELKAARANTEGYMERETAPTEASELPQLLNAADAAVKRVVDESTAALLQMGKLSEVLGASLAKAKKVYGEEAKALAQEQAAVEAEAASLETEKASLEPLRVEIEKLRTGMEKDCAVAMVAKQKRLERIHLEESSVNVALRLLRGNK